MGAQNPARGLLIIGICCFVITDATRSNYAGFKLHEILVGDMNKWNAVNTFIKDSQDEVDVWKWPEDVGDTLHVFLPPAKQQTWNDLCSRLSLECSVLINDIEKLLKEESDKNQVNSVHPGGRHPRSAEDSAQLRHRLKAKYPTLEQIEQWLKELNSTESLVSLIDIGTTYEGRSLYVVRITAAASEWEKLPAVWIDTGIHSREWVAHSSGIYTISNLLEGYYQSTVVRPLVENMVWYVMPVVNPDGYAFSHSTDRFWRKNRAPQPDNIRHGYNNTMCLGVDLNRNWDFHWGEVGVSTNSCWLTWPGYAAKSELETVAIQQYILKKAPGHIHGYVTIHSYGQMFLTRWAYVNDTPSDHEELYGLAKRTAETIKGVHGKNYIYGLSPRVLYAYAGGSPDWAKGVAGIKYSFSVELRDRGEHGFLLPTNQIVAVGEEIFEGLLLVAKQVMEYGQNISRALHLTTTAETADIDDATNQDIHQNTYLNEATSSQIPVDRKKSTSAAPQLKPIGVLCIISFLLRNILIFICI